VNRSPSEVFDDLGQSGRPLSLDDTTKSTWRHPHRFTMLAPRPFVDPGNAADRNCDSGRSSDWKGTGMASEVVAGASWLSPSRAHFSGQGNLHHLAPYPPCQLRANLPRPQRAVEEHSDPAPLPLGRVEAPGSCTLLNRQLRLKLPRSTTPSNPGSIWRSTPCPGRIPCAARRDRGRVLDVRSRDLGRHTRESYTSFPIRWEISPGMFGGLPPGSFRMLHADV